MGALFWGCRLILISQVTHWQGRVKSYYMHWEFLQLETRICTAGVVSSISCFHSTKLRAIELLLFDAWKCYGMLVLGTVSELYGFRFHNSIGQTATIDKFDHGNLIHWQKNSKYSGSFFWSTTDVIVICIALLNVLKISIICKTLGEIFLLVWRAPCICEYRSKKRGRSLHLLPQSGRDLMPTSRHGRE
jgi:hypothetical protein